MRNNKNHRRTPKWAQKYGLVDTSKIERDARKRQWANRYNDRLPNSVFEGQELAEGEVPDRPDQAQDGSSVLGPDARAKKGDRQRGERLWDEGDERYYGQRDGARRSTGSLDSSTASGGASSGGGGRWHYPANFEDTLPSETTTKKKKKMKKDRWARTEDAYNAPPSASKKHRKSKKNRSTVGGAEADGTGGDYNRSSAPASLDDGPSFPEDAEGGLYGERRKVGNGSAVPEVTASGRPRGELEHDF